jgi:hypothetical protein
MKFKNGKMEKWKIILASLIFLCAIFPYAIDVSAQQIEEYTLLAPIPLGGKITETLDGEGIFQDYLPGIFKTVIAFAAVLATVRIIWGGILYMSTDAIQGKSQGKTYITESIYGLVLISAAWLILYTINPKLVDIKLDLKSAKISSGEGARGTVCSGCGPMDGVLFSRSVNGGVNGTPELGTALKAFAAEYAGGDYTKGVWQVTEGNPPTVRHQDPCHARGTCVDANFIPGAVASPARNINSFVETAKKHGLTAVYEVTDSVQAAALRAVGVKAEYIMVNPKATGSHFHIKL